jgi:hypothetical protein
MKSLNFEILRNKWPELAELGASAENYAFSDPQSAMLKLRCFVEIIVNNIYHDLTLPFEKNWNLFDKLENKEFNQIISRPILDKFHAIRIKGNKAIHNNKVDTDAIWLIKEAYCIACWIYTSYKEGTFESCKEFIHVTDNGNKFDKLNETIKQLEETLEQEKQKQILSNVEHPNNEKIETFKNDNNYISNKLNLNSDEISKRISINDIFADYNLTSNQTSLVEELNRFLTDENKNVFLLKGYAGTGKTFIAKGLTEYLSSIGKNYILAAPTGKAAKVIKEKTNREAYTLHKTIYQYKDLKEYNIADTKGSETFKIYFDLASNEYSDQTIYIIDEASMIGDIEQNSEFLQFGSGRLLSDLMEFINIDHNDHNKKIIFIGDNAQLPPIGMNFSPALDDKYLQQEFNVNVDSFELTEVVRQSSVSGIVNNSLALRESIRNNIFNQLDFKTEFDDVNHLEYQDILNQYLKSCNHKINGDSIIIAHSNRVVDEYNALVRKHFFPNQEFLCSGDKVMSTTNNNTFGIFIYNGDFGLIRKVYPYQQDDKREVFFKYKINENEVITLKVPLWFRKVEIGFKNDKNQSVFFECYILENILYPSYVYKDYQIGTLKDKDIRSIEAKALYVDFKKRTEEKGLKEKSEEFKQEIKSDKYFNCLKVKYGYALTCHKAQGSEWKNVFVNCKTHEQILSKNYFRWLYTAITRASHNLYTIDEPHIQIFDGINTNVHTEHIQDTYSDNLPTKENTSNDNKFNIEDKFLLTIYQKIVSIIESNNISIVDIEHNQNQEKYTFESNNEQSRVTIYYNKQDIITTINPIETNNLSNLLKNILKPIKNHVLTVETHTNFTFNERFLEDFYLSLKNKLKNRIIIANIEHLNYMERYSFSRDNEIAIIDFIYNGNGQFTRTVPNNRSNSRQLIQDILGII